MSGAPNKITGSAGPGRPVLLLGLDAIMLVLVCILESLSLTGLNLHEWLGFVLCPLVLLHVVLQWNWVVAQFRRLRSSGAYRARANYLLNLLLLILMAAVLFSGILISTQLGPLVGETFGRSRIWNEIHGWLNFSLVVAVGLHLALNWDWILAAMRRRGHRFLLPSSRRLRSNRRVKNGLPFRITWLTVGLSFILSGCAARNPASTADRDSLAAAWRILSTKKFVDLTHTFSPATPVWQGFGPAVFAPAKDPATGRPYTLDKDGFQTYQYTLVGQYGTHIDPPAHFDGRGKTVDELPVKEMILPLVVFNITPLLHDDPNHALTIEDIKTWERAHGRVPAGSFAALRTDLSKDWTTNPDRFKRQPFPAWSPEAIQFLYEQRGIVANGHEAMDTDTTSEMKSETWLLKHGHWQIEVMANLDQVPATGALIVVAWPKPKGGLGFPVRAFAILP